MIEVPSPAMRHLIAAAEDEMARLEAIQQAVDDDWPADFDANDIQLFAMAVEALRMAKDGESGTVFLSGKPLWFLLNTLPDYISTKGHALSAQEYEALKQVYAQHPQKSPRRFPER